MALELEREAEINECFLSVLRIVGVCVVQCTQCVCNPHRLPIQHNPRKWTKFLMILSKLPMDKNNPKQLLCTLFMQLHTSSCATMFIRRVYLCCNK